MVLFINCLSSERKSDNSLKFTRFLFDMSVFMTCEGVTMSWNVFEFILIPIGFIICFYSYIYYINLNDKKCLDFGKVVSVLICPSGLKLYKL